MKRLLASLVLGFFFSGCLVDMSLGAGGSTDSGGDDGNGPVPPTEMARRDVCVQSECTKCKADCSECRTDCQMLEEASGTADYVAYVACLNQCSYPCDLCDDYCKNDVCLETAPAFVLPTVVDPEIMAACESAKARDVACGEYNVSQDCDHYAKVEGKHVVKSYDCIAAAPCNGDLSECWPAPGKFGTERCEAEARLCNQSCQPGSEQSMNENAAWLKPSVLAAGLTCFQEYSCEEYRACFEAWVKAVDGG